jgi:hypothetical protein
MSLLHPGTPALYCSRGVNQSATGKDGVCGILLSGETMKSFLERLAARDDLPSASSGLSLSKAAESEGAVLFATWVWVKPQP